MPRLVVLLKKFLARLEQLLLLEVKKGSLKGKIVEVMFLGIPYRNLYHGLYCNVCCILCCYLSPDM